MNKKQKTLKEFIESNYNEINSILECGDGGDNVRHKFTSKFEYDKKVHMFYMTYTCTSSTSDAIINSTYLSNTHV